MNAITRKNKLKRQQTNLLYKYRALFLNDPEIEGLDYGVKEFLMNKLLYSGQIAAFKLNINKEVGAKLGFGSFVPKLWDWKNKPIKVKILNEKGSPLIPTNDLYNDKEVVLLELDFIPNSFILEYVDRIMDIEATINTNLQVHKLPWIIKSSDPKTIRAIKKLLQNEEVIWVDELQFEVIEAKAPYIIDKLQLYKSETEAELLSVLGIDNVKFEKKAQMTKDEVNSNNDEIDAYRMIFRHKLEEFFKQIKEVLGFDIKLKKDKDEVFDKGGDLNDEL